MRIIIRPDDVVKLYGVKYKRASELIVRIRIALGKRSRQRLTIKEFCNYEGLPLDETLNSLNLSK